ncbi:type II secretion system F family protein [Isoptericola jiangsuensis]|uniref:type II secretion system F family protein n=1 Tax=Isoptericola jiangsuensis TaxID=548579 RepID=UPI003AAD80DC
MTAGLLVLALFITLALVVVTVAVFQGNAVAQRRMVASADLAAGAGPSLVDRIDVRLRTTTFGKRVASSLAGAGLQAWSPTLFLLGTAGLALACGLLSMPLLGRAASLLVILAVVASAQRWVDSKRRARTERFVTQLPEVARLLANGAQAGLAVRRSVEMAAREMDEPARSELAQVSSEMAVGQSLQNALANLSERLPSRELSVLVQTLAIQGRSGGALVTALGNIASALEERRQLRREIKTATVGASFTGYAVILIGVGAVVLMNLMTPGVLDDMLGTFLGQIILVVAGALFLLGWLLMRRISKVEL